MKVLDCFEERKGFLFEDSWKMPVEDMAVIIKKYTQFRRNK